MDSLSLKSLLTRVAAGECDVDEALSELQPGTPHPGHLDEAVLDLHRAERTGIPEVIFGAGKTPEQIVAIAEEMTRHTSGFLATRLSPEAAAALRECWPHGRHDELARAFSYGASLGGEVGDVLVVTAGTSDLPAAHEALLTLEHLGDRSELITDVGVAGIHRVLERTARLREARTIIVAAGMEGALASVIAGLVSCPVIAVPTSVGYGASFAGLAALLGMLSSCAPGVSVVNIDNGFGAACIASRINRA